MEGDSNEDTSRRSPALGPDPNVTDAIKAHGNAGNCDKSMERTSEPTDMASSDAKQSAIQGDCDLSNSVTNNENGKQCENEPGGCLVAPQVPSTSRCPPNKNEMIENGETSSTSTSTSNNGTEMVDAILKRNSDLVKQGSESDIQSTCSTGNLNESRESVFYSDQSSESNAASTAVIKNVDNTSLCNLLIYTSEDSESDSSTDEEIDDYESSLEDRTLETPTGKSGGKQGESSEGKSNISETLRAMNDLNLEDLPPVPDPRTLKVDVQEKDCEKMGTISSIIDEIVMVESLPNMPAYDSDTLLFLDKGKQPLGYVYDVIGPVSQPLYAVRFNNMQEIQALNISKGLPVFSAPKTEHTQFVFLKELMKIKGSDASWKNDVEAPAEFADFSDDEQEAAARRGKKADKQQNLHCNRKRNSLERHQNFEKDMNVRNLIDTRLHKIRDTYEPANKKYVPQNTAAPCPPKRGFPFPQIWNRPQFAFTTQANASGPVPSFAQMPHVSGVIGSFPRGVNPGMPMATFGSLPPNVATFVPHIPPPMLPPTFRPNIPPPPMNRTPMDNVPPPIFQGFAPAPTPSPMPVGSKTPDARQSSVCMYPASMGLPRAQNMQPQPPMLVTSGNSIPPNMTFYRPPQMQQWFTYPNPMGPHGPAPHSRTYSGSGRGYYPHKRP